MLNLAEIDRIQHLLGDEATLKVIEKVFNEALDNNLPSVGPIDDNLVIGQKYRAYEMAKGIVRVAFTDLLSWKREGEKENKIANRGK